ncbi:membrane protein [Belnapia moabensis]|uniref:membrane protein n=1 Tax=Belnapia moabensis TaxID=365533 RepID=UPI0005BC3822|nr:membrane protein [Belnapia moabensis]
MQQALSGIDFAPVLPVWLIAALAVLAMLALVPALLRRARGAALRALTFALLLLALANPRLVEETRETRPDIALLVVDRSDSARIGNRAQQIEAARTGVEARAAKLPDLELRTVEVPEGGNQGTRLFTATERALADIPRARLAGVIALTDGQVHDVPAASPIEAPFHALLPGRPGETDRRLRVVEAPGFGIVGRSVELRVAVEDLGVPNATGAARLSIRRDGAPARIESVPIGREHRIELPIERGGPTVVELAAEARPGEVSELNNRAVVTITGVRDRLRVLLVSGEPHAGERTWRRLLKADPGVDLVHFTILRPPEKDDLTPLNELALIAFPVRELFQVKLREFDLVVFDRFANRGILPPAYLRNIADYVRGGGALLMSVGPEFAGPTSLANTPLGAVLPARPAAGAGQSAVAEGAFRPSVTALGSRHPVTEGLTGANPDEQRSANWGRWYRSLRVDQRGGATVMAAADGAPLLLLDRVGEGRVALLLSDHIWLWSRGHDGGGPQAELLRRAAHWLMREPELEEEDLTARIEAGQLVIQRRSVEPGPPPEVTITAPDASTQRRPLEGGQGGHATARVPADQPGVWQVSDGRRSAFAAAAAANPAEVADLRADPARLAPILAGTGGAARWLGTAAEPALPELRRVGPGRDARGGDPQAGWIGLRRNGDHTVTGIAAMPLLPPWLALPMVLGLAVFAWRREGR